MKMFLGIAIGIAALAIPGMAQTHAAPPQQTTLRNAAYHYGYQDQDDRNHDRDDRDRRDGQYGQYGQNQYGNRNYSNVLAPEWQSKFDSYYQRWQQYRSTNNREGVNSMQERMYSIMDNYHIPRSVPFGEIASQGGTNQYNNGGYYGNNGNYNRGDRDDYNRGYGRAAAQLSPADQQRFNSYYQRWVRARSTNDRDDMQGMEQRMRDIYSRYNIPQSVPFGQVANGGGYQR